jgi:hypothetical protein
MPSGNRFFEWIQAIIIMEGKMKNLWSMGLKAAKLWIFN